MIYIINKNNKYDGTRYSEEEFDKFKDFHLNRGQSFIKKDNDFVLDLEDLPSVSDEDLSLAKVEIFRFNTIKSLNDKCIELNLLSSDNTSHWRTVQLVASFDNPNQEANKIPAKWIATVLKEMDEYILRYTVKEEDFIPSEEFKTFEAYKIDTLDNVVFTDYKVSNNQKATQYVDTLILNKITDYNKVNGTDFKDINSLPKFALVPTYEHYQFCIDTIEWVAKLWQVARNSKATNEKEFIEEMSKV